MNKHAFVSLCALLLAVPASGSARPRGKRPAEDRPTVLVLQAADDEAGQLSEDYFASELRLELDRAAVHVELLGGTGFAREPVDGQIARVRELIGKHKAIAAVWITAPSGESLVLHLVSVSEGRSLLRSVETPRSDASESELASVARELLGAMTLVEAAKPKWSSRAGARASAGVVGQKGPSLWLGGRVGFEYNFVKGLYGRIDIEAFGGPIGRSRDLDVRGWALDPGIGLAYLFDLGPVAIGPFLGFYSWWSNVDLKAGSGPWDKSMEWQFRSLLAFELRIYLARIVDLSVSAGVSASAEQERYYRVSDDRLVFATPLLSFEGAVQLVFYIR